MCKKAELRREWTKIRDGVLNRTKKSEEICHRVLALPEVVLAKTVFVYISFRSEPETPELIKRLLDNGKRVAVPKCDKITHTMTAVQISSLEDLKPGAYGILEPIDGAKELPKTDIDVALVPALAFDKRGFRLGYGAGYYDRYLSGFSGTSIGLAFSDCLTEVLPVDETDVPVNILITEK